MKLLSDLQIYLCNAHAKEVNNDNINGRPLIAIGHAHQYGLFSTSSAFPTHERLNPKYPNEKTNPVIAAFLVDSLLFTYIYKQLRPTNIDGQKLAGAIDKDENAPIIKIIRYSFMKTF